MTGPGGQDELAWIRARTPDDDSGMTGFDADGWEESVWILHRLWENGDVPEEISWDDVRQHELRTGRAEPLVISEVNLEEGTVSTGVPLGGRSAMPAPWHRLRWSELAWRVGITFDDVEYPPGFKWFPYNSWPARFAPPCEGSMERADLVALVDVLGRHSADGQATRCYASAATLRTASFDRVEVHPTTPG